VNWAIPEKEPEKPKITAVPLDPDEYEFYEFEDEKRKEIPIVDTMSSQQQSQLKEQVSVAVRKALARYRDSLGTDENYKHEARRLTKYLVNKERQSKHAKDFKGLSDKKKAAMKQFVIDSMRKKGFKSSKPSKNDGSTTHNNSSAEGQSK
jgi:hypothetical protein